MASKSGCQVANATQEVKRLEEATRAGEGIAALLLDVLTDYDANVCAWRFEGDWVVVATKKPEFAEVLMLTTACHFPEGQRWAAGNEDPQATQEEA